MKVRLCVLFIGLVLFGGACLQRRIASAAREWLSGARVSSLLTEGLEDPEVVAAETPLPPVAVEEEVEPAPEEVRFENWVDPRLVWLCRNQNEDGSWGSGPTPLGGLLIDREGITSLVIGAIVNAGYSHLSKDEYKEVRLGESVKKAAKWLLGRQLEDGTFRTGGDAALDHVLATYALSELYGMSATRVFKDPAKRAADALNRNFGVRALLASDARAGWSALAIRSAQESELFDATDGIVAEASAYLHPALAAENRVKSAAWAELTGVKINPELKPLAEKLAAESFDPAWPDLAGWRVNARILGGSEGRDGATWGVKFQELISSTRRIWDAGWIQLEGSGHSPVLQTGLLAWVNSTALRYFPTPDC